MFVLIHIHYYLPYCSCGKFTITVHHVKILLTWLSNVALVLAERWEFFFFVVVVVKSVLNMIIGIDLIQVSIKSAETNQLSLQVYLLLELCSESYE